jgi:hypothetical protein
MVQQYSDSYGDKTDEEPLAVKVPDSTQNTDENLLFDEKPEKNKKGLSRGQKILAGLAIFLVLGTGGGMAANMALNEHPVAAISSSEKSSLPSQTSSSEVSSSVAEVLPTVESLEIDPSVLSDPNTLAKTWINERITAWVNSGATINNMVAALSSGNTKKYSEKIASEYDKVFADALLVNGWESNPTLKKWFDNIALQHQQTLNLYFNTSLPNVHPEDIEPYKLTDDYAKVNSLVKTQNGDYVLSETDHTYDNADKNRTLILTGGERVDVYGTGSITFTIVDGKVRMSNLS